MAKKNKKKKYLVILSVILVFSFIFNTSFIKIKKLVDGNLLPFQAKIFNTAFSLEKIKNFGNIIKENENLKFENMRLKENLTILESVKEENKRLTTLLDIKEKHKYEKDIKVARVIHKNIHNLYNQFYIDLGKEDGIEINVAVIYDKYLVGRVVEILDSYSRVDIITNPKIMVSTKTESGILGIVRGSDEEDGKMYFQPSIFEDEIKVGENIYTSGIGSLYPEGLEVGKITKLKEEQNYLFKSIEVEPGFKIKDLREVIVYKYGKKQGIK